MHIHRVIYTYVHSRYALGGTSPQPRTSTPLLFAYNVYTWCVFAAFSVSCFQGGDRGADREVPPAAPAAAADAAGAGALAAAGTI